MAESLASICGLAGGSKLYAPFTGSIGNSDVKHEIGHGCSVKRQHGSAAVFPTANDRSHHHTALGRAATERSTRKNNGSGLRTHYITTASPQDQTASRPSSLTEYHDSSLEITAIEFLTSRIGHVSGKKTDLKGYDGFVDITKKLVQGLPSKEQRATVGNLFDILIPRWTLYFFRLVPRTTFVTEVYARVTSIFFRWLVGETEIREAEVKGVLMRSTVHVKKCRYLEHSNCVGMCVNLCKSPTQEFIGKQLGMPLTMKPNFEDLSCDMVYGMHPPPLEEDEAFRQPCFSTCSTSKAHTNCA